MRINVKNLVAVLSIVSLTLGSFVFLTDGAVAQGGAVQVISYSSYIQYKSYKEIFSGATYSGDFLHIVGEVQNTIQENIEISEITPIFYDENGAVIEAGPINSWLDPLDILEPGQKSPFGTILLDEEASGRVDHYEFSVDYTTTTEEPVMLEIPNTHSSYGTTYNPFVAVGEVENTGEENLEFVKAFATFYNDQGTVIGADFTFISIDILLPGQKTPFSLSNFAPTEINEQIRTYSLCAEGRITTKEPYRKLQIVTHSPEIVYGNYEVRGDVKNIGETPATFVKVVATFYDSSGKIVESDYGYTDPTDLAPDQTGSFWVYLMDEELSSKVATYTLQVQCFEFSDIWLYNLQITPSTAEAGEEITITVDADNYGDIPGTRTVTLKINGVVESTKDVTLNNGETGSVTFTVTKQESGTYTVEVAGLGGSFTVTSTETETPTSSPETETSTPTEGETSPPPSESEQPTSSPEAETSPSPSESDSSPPPLVNETVLIAIAAIGGCSAVGVGLYLGLKKKSGT